MIEVMKPGCWLKFHDYDAFIASVIIDSNGGVCYKLIWFDGKAMLETLVHGAMIGGAFKNGERLTIGFKHP